MRNSDTSELLILCEADYVRLSDNQPEENVDIGLRRGGSGLIASGPWAAQGTSKSNPSNCPII